MKMKTFQAGGSIAVLSQLILPQKNEDSECMFFGRFALCLLTFWKEEDVIRFFVVVFAGHRPFSLDQFE